MRLALAFFAATLMLSGAQPAAAAPLSLTPLNVVNNTSTFQQFNFFEPGPAFVFNSTTGEIFDGFRLTAAMPVFIRVTDIGMPGEAFDVFVNGALRLSTPGVSANPNIFVSNPALAFGNPNFSFGQFTLAPGTYEITINLRQGTEGGAFIQATPTPEPATLLLLGTGLISVVAIVRRRRIDGDASRA